MFRVWVMRETSVSEKNSNRHLSLPISKYWAWLPAVLVAAGIAMLSLTEHPDTFLPPSASDKVMHGVAYFVLAVTLYWALRSCRKTWLNGIYAFVGSAAYGLLMEVLQRYCTVSRTGELSDLVADMGGALLGVIICIILFRK